MTLTIDPDSGLEIEDLEIERIFADTDFNCRGYIPLSAVVDLAKDIDKNGLQQPITVQPYDKKPGFDWRIIQGHRRFTAMRDILHRRTIPAMIKEGLTELQALILNFGENIQREPLNILQEAKALQKLSLAGMTQLDIAKTLRQERPWVQTRLYVLDFPEDIQAEIADGMLTQPQIHEIHALPKAQWYEAVRMVKEAKIRAGSKRVRVSVSKLKPPKAENLLKAKPRKKEEIEVMVEHMIDAGNVGLHTRALAWASGEIDTMTLLEEFKKDCEVIGLKYHIPTQGISGL